MKSALDSYWLSKRGLHIYLITEVVYGNKAIFLARLIANANWRWCFAQLPDILLGVILPRSVVKYLSVLVSL